MGNRLLRWGRHGIAWGFFAVGLICLTLVVLMIYRGDVWAWIIYAEKPVPHLLGGLGALFAWYTILFGYRNTRTQWIQWIGRVSLVAFACVFTLLAGEVALRMYGMARLNAGSIEELKRYQRQGAKPPVRSTHPLALIVQLSDDPRVVYELQPDLDTEFGHHRLKTNHDGIRATRDYPVERTSDGVRIVGIGDSGMFGWDLEPGEEYLAVLESQLNTSTNGIRLEAINLAVPGYNTQLEVEMLRFKGLKYRPDIVILGWCENDFGLPYFFLEKEDYRRTDKSFLFDILFRRARQGTAVQPGLVMRDVRQYDRNRVVPEMMGGTNTDGVRRALVELRKMGEQHGFQILVFGPLHNEIRTLCSEVGVPIANTLELVPAGKYPKDYRVHAMHPSREGHRVLAECLAQTLADRGWLTRREQNRPESPQ